MLLDTNGASEYLMQQHGVKRAPRTLANLRSQGGGPCFRRISPVEVMYEDSELDRWVWEDLLGEPVSNNAPVKDAARLIPDAAP